MKPHLALIILLTGTALAQGPLTPPPGADPSIGPFNALNAGGLPQATMKTLHQVEPRTAIIGSTSGVTISQSGSYYLMGNITVPSGHGVVIEADGVTLDLNGFTIATSETTATSFAVAIGYNQKNVSVKNGNIQGAGSGVFQNGVGGSNGMGPPRNVRVSGLNISNCAVHGIVLDQSKNNRVEDCAVDGAGIAATTVKTSCVTNGFINARIVTECTLETTGAVGITAEVVQNCSAISAGNSVTAKVASNIHAIGGGNGAALDASVTMASWAKKTAGSGRAIAGEVVSFSRGESTIPFAFGGPDSLGIESKVVTGSYGNGGGYGVNGDQVSGSLGIGHIAISASNVAASIGRVDPAITGGGILANLVTSSLGRAAAASPGDAVYGIFSKVVIGSKGETGNTLGGYGIGADGGLVVESFGENSGTPANKIFAPLKFNSN